MLFYSDRNKRDATGDPTEQYRLVRARVKTDDGRMQAYGWSLPAKGSSVTSIIPPVALQKVKGQMPVPVPIYCKPVTTIDSTMKVNILASDRRVFAVVHPRK
jgi:hypothetical protein